MIVPSLQTKSPSSRRIDKTGDGKWVTLSRPSWHALGKLVLNIIPFWNFVIRHLSRYTERSHPPHDTGISLTIRFYPKIGLYPQRIRINHRFYLFNFPIFRFSEIFVPIHTHSWTIITISNPSVMDYCCCFGKSGDRVRILSKRTFHYVWMLFIHTLINARCTWNVMNNPFQGYSNAVGHGRNEKQTNEHGRRRACMFLWPS